MRAVQPIAISAAAIAAFLIATVPLRCAAAEASPDSQRRFDIAQTSMGVPDAAPVHPAPSLSTPSSPRLCNGQSVEQRILYEDNFTSSSGNWERADGVRIGDGRMDITLGTDSMVRTVLNRRRLAGPGGDFCVRFKLAEPDPDNGSSGSIVFWAQDEENGFTVDFWSNGALNFGRSTNGTWTELLAMDDSQSAWKGNDDVTELRVVAGNGLLKIWLNGALTKSTELASPQGNFRFGVYVEMDKEPAAPKHFQFTYFNVLEIYSSLGR
ncbi:MAG: hypothetical protein E7813_15210 [Bradyrhizobium sp.]|uniref:hypothetical protein n=1 Tax=Bradyrhizobium sp. TaxID=376 RepID=UPI0011F58F41|nr:hypothetical protein [Bradyrhizobium sp.]THD65379.1 MAG: hypothetical protein E7813_15210 [Bradyrhizobium sp.]